MIKRTEKKSFFLFPNCKLVCGNKRDAIYDLQMQRVYYIPRNFFNKHGFKNPINICDIDLLIQLENLQIGYFSDKRKYPDIKYNNPSKLLNIRTAIIDFSSLKNTKRVLNILSEYGLECCYIISPKRIAELLNLLHESPVIHVALRSSINKIEKHLHLIQNFPKIERVDIPKFAHEERIFKSNSKLNFISNINPPNQLNWTGFNINRALINTKFFEIAQENNPFYFQTIYVNRKLHIFNSPFHNYSYGVISKNSLSRFFNSQKTKELWEAKKDNNAICRNCENRYLCLDPRPPNFISKTQFTLKGECNYNPFESTYD